ncbi:uncharacterized protein LOC117173568 [Belonocnema kinseyi]|uniref:uncharacterized protein LOC117173568 n=1 Tax=Belonocnema kinseyi TaxID=2817044 RepID=UPI00143D69C0|nr:uncharacterized protein LOC117173568 [Belonocnema kinseyi]
MVREEECPCSESSKLSHVTSLASENGNSDFKEEPENMKHDDCKYFQSNRFNSVSCQAVPDNFLKKEQTYRLSSGNIPVNFNPDLSQETPPMWNRASWKWPRSGYLKKKDKTYEVKLNKKRCQHSPKPYVLYEISKGKPRKKEELTNQNQEVCLELGKGEPAERIDIYYFDHGNSA